MRKLIFGVFAVAMALVLSACGDRVEVPPAHVGKVLTSNGFKPDTVPPSKFRLDACWAYCDRLVLAELSDAAIKESFTVFMPKDELTMTFDVRATVRIKGDETSVNQIFDKVVPSGATEVASVITLDQIYDVYGRQVLRDVIRTAVAEYTIAEVAASRGAVNAAITAAVEKGLSHTPLVSIRIGLAKVEYPEIITKAKEIAKEREVAIQTAEADKQITLVGLQKDLEVARMQRNIDKEKAEATKEQNAIIAAGVTDAYIKWKTLEVLEALATSDNNVFVPMAALDSLGFQQRVFSTQNESK